MIIKLFYFSQDMFELFTFKCDKNPTQMLVYATNYPFCLVRGNSIFLKNVATNAIKSMYKSSIVKTHYQ